LVVYPTIHKVPYIPSGWPWDFFHQQYPTNLASITGFPNRCQVLKIMALDATKETCVKLMVGLVGLVGWLSLMSRLGLVGWGKLAETCLEKGFN